MLKKIISLIEVFAATKEELAANAIRDMFLGRQYEGTISVKDMDTVLKSTRWHKMWGKKELRDAWKKLQDDEYVSKEGDNWQWNIEGSFSATGTD